MFHLISPCNQSGHRCPLQTYYITRISAAIGTGSVDGTLEELKRPLPAGAATLSRYTPPSPVHAEPESHFSPSNPVPTPKPPVRVVGRQSTNGSGKGGRPPVLKFPVSVTYAAISSVSSNAITPPAAPALSTPTLTGHPHQSARQSLPPRANILYNPNIRRRSTLNDESGTRPSRPQP